MATERISSPFSLHFVETGSGWIRFWRGKKKGGKKIENLFGVGGPRENKFAGIWNSSYSMAAGSFLESGISEESKKPPGGGKSRRGV